MIHGHCGLCGKPATFFAGQVSAHECTPQGVYVPVAEESQIYPRVTKPPRCSARRKMTLWERIKWKVLGADRGFNPWEETQCNLHQGHEVPDTWGYYPDHEDVTGYKWPVDASKS